METLIKTGRIFYGVCLCGIAVQQIVYGAFRPVVLPEVPAGLPACYLWVSLSSALFLGAGVAMIINWKGKQAALLIGTFCLALFVVYDLPYMLFVNPYVKHLGVWTNPLKMLALAGGAFVMAGSYAQPSESVFLKALEKVIPYGKIFFSVTMILFGIDHFLYTQFVSTLVPVWFPGATFWTYFGAIALIGAGLAIVFDIKLELVGLLLGTMLFLWFISLHIPRAIADPFGDKGNEVTSVFQALGFSGIAFVLAFGIKDASDLWELEKRIDKRFQD